MRKVNVLLVYPNRETVLRIPLAISILSSALREAGHNVGVLDTTFLGNEFKTDFDYSEKKGTVKKANLRDYVGKLDDRSIDETVKENLRDFSPDLIAITVLERNYSNAIQVLKTLKKYSDAPVIAGGIMASIAPEVLISVKEIDMICVGEGEEAIVEISSCLVKGGDVSDIKNLWIKKDGGVIRSPLRPLIDLDSVPKQDWEYFDRRHLYRAFQGKVYKNGTFEFSRGCQKFCSFCVAPQLRNLQKGLGSYHRFKSPEYAIEEIYEKKRDYGLTLIHFGDTDFLFGMKKETLKEFVKLYKEKIGLPFFIQSGGETLNEESIKLLKEAGCVNVSVGVESGSQRVRQTIIHKYVSKKKLIEVFGIARRYKLRITANYMMGLPDETERDIWETIKFNRELNPPAIASYFFTPFIGTELYEISLSKGYIDGFKPSNLHKESPLTMPHLSQQRIGELMQVFIDDFKSYQDEY